MDKFSAKPFPWANIDFNTQGSESSEQIMTEIESRFLAEIKKQDSYQNLFVAEEYQGTHFLQIPANLGTQRALFNTVKKDFSVLIDMFSIDDHPSLISGMTADTMDLSQDHNYVKSLFEKITHIKNIKTAKLRSTKPFVIIWDTTLEIYQGPCYAMIERFRPEIEKGEMVFILIKSLQKYASLGVGKIKAGVTTLIGHKNSIQSIDTELSKQAQDIWSRQASELSLMVFYYDRFIKKDNQVQAVVGLQDNESVYYAATVKHAKKNSRRKCPLFYFWRLLV